MSLEGSILGMGNPLLDISAHVSTEVLEKYGVSLNNAILAEEKHFPVYEDLVKNFEVEYIAGGATQNSIRVAQWFLQVPNATAYIGSVGKDDFADQLTKSASADGVKVHYHVDPETPTGTCACLIVNHERSLIANLAAANKYDIAHLKSPEVAAVLDKAKFVYISGYFITVSPPSIMLAAEKSLAQGKTFVMNLAAPFICQFFDNPLMEALPYVDIVIGNQSEAEAFAQKQGFESTEPEFVAMKLAALPKKNAEKPRIAIVTQGHEDTILCIDGKISRFAVPQIPDKEIVDVNGAGDAFVGGVLAGLAMGKSIEVSIHYGHYCAGVIIRVSGTTLSAVKPDYKPIS